MAPVLACSRPRESALYVLSKERSLTCLRRHSAGAAGCGLPTNSWALRKAARDSTGEQGADACEKEYWLRHALTYVTPQGEPSTPPVPAPEIRNPALAHSSAGNDFHHGGTSFVLKYTSFVLKYGGWEHGF